MDIEQLKLILETISGLGADTKEAVIWWFVFDFVKFLLGYGIIAGALYAAVHVIMRLIDTNKGVAESALTDIRDELGIGMPGSLSKYEITQTRSSVMELIRKHKIKAL